MEPREVAELPLRSLVFLMRGARIWWRAGRIGGARWAIDLNALLNCPHSNLTLPNRIVIKIVFHHTSNVGLQLCIVTRSDSGLQQFIFTNVWIVTYHKIILENLRFVPIGTPKKVQKMQLQKCPICPRSHLGGHVSW